MISENLKVVVCLREKRKPKSAYTFVKSKKPKKSVFRFLYFLIKLFLLIISVKFAFDKAPFVEPVGDGYAEHSPTVFHAAGEVDA